MSGPILQAMSPSNPQFRYKIDVRCWHCLTDVTSTWVQPKTVLEFLRHHSETIPLHLQPSSCVFGLVVRWWLFCASSHDDGVVCVCVCTVSLSKYEVVIGGTHLKSNFVVSHETSMCMSTASVESTVREGLMHLVLCLVERLMVVRPTGVERQTLHSSTSVCTSTMSLCSSAEEGLAPLPSSSHCREVLRRRRDIRRLRRRRDRPSSSQRR